MNTQDLIASVRGLLGGIVGGAIGYGVYRWFHGHGYFGPMIPGTLLGFGWGLASRHRSLVDGTIAAICGLTLGVVSTWSTDVRADQGLFWFVSNITSRLSSPSLLMVLIGAGMAFWLGMGRRQLVNPKNGD